jgi:hypothetical protein
MQTTMEQVSDIPSTSRYNEQFEEYRRHCRERYEQQRSRIVDCERFDQEDHSPSATLSFASVEFSSATALDCTTTSITTSATSCNATPSFTSAEITAAHERSQESCTKKGFSWNGIWSNLFSKKDKERKKGEEKRREEDEGIARLVECLQLEGRSDEEIAEELFKLRLNQQTPPAAVQAEAQRKGTNAIVEYFKAVQQAIREEMQAIREDFQFRNNRNASSRWVIRFADHHDEYPVPLLGPYDYEDLSYEALSQLEAVPRGVKSLAHLPIHVYNGNSDLLQNQTSCAICLVDFIVDEELRSLQCQHYFHRECIDRWLEVGKTCPVCKSCVE